MSLTWWVLRALVTVTLVPHGYENVEILGQIMIQMEIFRAQAMIDFATNLVKNKKRKIKKPMSA